MRKAIIYILLFFGLTNAVFAQIGGTTNVKVVKPYEPVISDAFKLSELPKINDTLKVTPSFSYEITPVKYETRFSPTQIKPAKLIKEPLPKLYYGYAKVGFGFLYLSPLAELSVGSKRSNNWQWNSLVHYQGSNGKVKHKDGEKVYAGLNEFSVGGKAKRFFDNNTELSLNALFSGNSSYYYGYNPDSITATRPALLEKDEIEKQSLKTLSFGGAFATNHLDSAHINYKIKADWKTITTIDDALENQITLGTNIDYFFEKEFLGIDADINIFSNRGFQDTTSFGVINFNPWIGAFGNKWEVIVGVNTSLKTDSSSYHFYPRVSIHYNIIDHFLIPYVEVTGNYKVNTFADLYAENSFIRNDLTVKPTNNKYKITFGFRGNISSQIAFNIKADYASYTDKYFYVNDTSLPYSNKFDVVYDDLKQMRLLGEISYKSSGKLFLSLKGNYYKNSLSKEEYAWHLPEYDLSFNARYSIQDKIITEVNVFGIGKRYAREFDLNKDAIAVELPGIIDLNLGVEYRYTKVLSAFAKINNIGAVKYYKWHNYPTHQFNIMVGASYSF